MGYKNKSVFVLMSTYNGEKYLEAQLESLLRQENINVNILVRDDGSDDSTIEILQKYKQQDILDWYSGDNLKPGKSFLNLVDKVQSADYYAFCDQDDIWNEDKLCKAISLIESSNNNSPLPILYCSNYQLVDENLSELPDQFHASTDLFSNSLVSSCCTGCTVVFNHELLKILKSYTPEVMVMHDDWAHKVCLAVGGKVIYDKSKTLMYRQHGNNADGGVRTLNQKIQGISKRIKSGECIRSKQIQQILIGYSDIMPSENIELASLVCNYKKSFSNKLKILFNIKLSTPYKELNVGFYLAILFGYF